MVNKNKTLVMLVVSPLGIRTLASQVPIELDSASKFAVLGGTGVASTGDTAVHGGDVGTSHGEAITGFPPGMVIPPFESRVGDAATKQAHVDLVAAYNAATRMKPTHDLSGQNLGGLTLLPGVYYFSAAAELTGTLTLNGQNDPKAQFVFQVGTTLATAEASAVISINGASSSGAGSSIFWLVAESAVLGADSAFEGNILVQKDITINTDASIRDGCVLACAGAVNLNSNKITKRFNAV
ncbi:MAG: DUF3494 domain-containing protein [Phycisphaerales bacterium]|nr:DUF3494 domain-containing protein [Phycisphaerales bacterium]